MSSEHVLHALRQPRPRSTLEGLRTQKKLAEIKPGASVATGKMELLPYYGQNGSLVRSPHPYRHYAENLIVEAWCAGSSGAVYHCRFLSHTAGPPSSPPSGNIPLALMGLFSGNLLSPGAPGQTSHRREAVDFGIVDATPWS
jgi:hypothetical protein